MTSKACCTVPPVVTSGYVPKGTYSEYAGMKTYVTGDTNSKTAVLFIFDIFGFFPQTLQGADMIAAAGNLVIMPDFFFGPGIDIALFPPDTPEKQAAVGAFFVKQAAFEPAQANVGKILPELKSAYPSAEKWGVIGLCWGGKVAVLSAGPSTHFNASIQVHSARITPDDAEKFTIPHLCLASPEEPPEDIAKVAEVLKNHPNEAVRSKSYVETYPTMFHGWMGARAKLEDEENAKEFERGYKQVVNFFYDTLTASK